MANYHVTIVRDDGYYAQSDDFDAELSSQEHKELVGFLNNARKIGQIQQFKVELPRPGLSFQAAQDRAITFIKHWQDKALGGPGMGRN